MREIRRLIREFLIWLPGRIGEEIILPRVRHIYDKYIPFLEWRTKKYCANEAKRIQSSITSGTDNFTIVYDSQAIGFSYAPVLNMLGIARYAISQEVFLNFYIVKPEYLHRDQTHDPNEITYFLNEIVDISETLLDSEHSSVRLISPATLTEVVHELGDSSLLFADFTRNRRPFYRDCWNVLNYLMADLPESVQDRILLSSRDFEMRFPTMFDADPYISWHCRYSSNYDFGRQTLPDEFLKCYQYLKTRFENHQIVIISDSVGCEHYASVANDLNIQDLMFSKDYSDDFLGDAALVLNSKFFFSFRGGGMGQIAELSRISYECLGAVMNDNFWDRKRFSSWQGDSQIYIVLEKNQFVDDRSLDVELIGSGQTESR